MSELFNLKDLDFSLLKTNDYKSNTILNNYQDEERKYQVTSIQEKEDGSYEISINNNEKATIKHFYEGREVIANKLKQLIKIQQEIESRVNEKIEDYKKDLAENLEYQPDTYSKRFNDILLNKKITSKWKYTQNLGDGNENWSDRPLKVFNFKHKNPMGFHTDCNGLISNHVREFVELGHGVSGYTQEELQKFKQMSFNQGATGQAMFLLEMNQKYGGSIIESKLSHFGKNEKENLIKAGKIAEQLKPNTIGFYASDGKSIGHIVVVIENDKNEKFVAEFHSKRKDYELTPLAEWIAKTNVKKDITFVDLYPNQENAIRLEKERKIEESANIEKQKLLEKEYSQNKDMFLKEEEVRQIEEIKEGMMVDYFYNNLTKDVQDKDALNPLSEKKDDFKFTYRI